MFSHLLSLISSIKIYYFNYETDSVLLHLRKAKRQGRLKSVSSFNFLTKPLGGSLVMFKGVVFLACLVTCCSAQQVPCHAGFFGSKGQACRGGSVIRPNKIA